VSNYLMRQRDIIPASVLGEQITIIGAGAIGGWTTLALAKMGFSNLRVIDFDDVSEENMNSQFYRINDIGLPKVVALKELVKSFTDVDIEAEYRRYEGEQIFHGIVIFAVDSMGVRRLIWDKHRGSPFTRAIIDPRMGAESALLYVMKPSLAADMEVYEKTLYTDDQAEEERCTAKATMYTASLLSGLVCKSVKDLMLCSSSGPMVLAPNSQSTSLTGMPSKPTPGRYLRTAQWNIAANAVQLWEGSTT
jgi:hypothetical protein